MENVKRLEVITLMFHFILTLFILGGYMVTVWKGIPDETMKNLLLLVGGWWFGAVSGSKVKDLVKKNPKRKDDTE